MADIIYPRVIFADDDYCAAYDIDADEYAGDYIVEVMQSGIIPGTFDSEYSARLAADAVRPFVRALESADGAGDSAALYLASDRLWRIANALAWLGRPIH